MTRTSARVALALSASLLAGCEEPVDEDFDPYQKISIEGGMDFYYYASAPMDEPRNVGRYKNLFVFQHGGGLDDIQHYNAATRALQREGLLDDTLVVVASFRDANNRNNYYWTQFGWKDGKKSINGVPKISSYTVFDTLLLDHVLVSYDQIETLVLSGHSAGGQFIYRYAALSDLPDIVDQDVIYLPMNPSSVVFLGPERWNPVKERFEVPLNGPSCPTYDGWIYGVSGLTNNEYRREMTPEEVRATFPWRRLVVATGDQDFGGSTDCASLYQGPHRHARALNAAEHTKTFYPYAIHDTIVVPGVAHNRDRMINSPEVMEFLTKVLE